MLSIINPVGGQSAVSVARRTAHYRRPWLLIWFNCCASVYNKKSDHLLEIASTLPCAVLSANRQNRENDGGSPVGVGVKPW
jgi:hypothetical protein